MRPGWWLSLVALAQACAGDMGDQVGEVRGALDATPAAFDAAASDAAPNTAIVFDNTGGLFTWTPTWYDPWGGQAQGAYLDLTVSAGSQSGEASPSGIEFFKHYNDYNITWGSFHFRSDGRPGSPPPGPGLSVAAGDDIIRQDMDGSLWAFTPPLTMTVGETVDAGLRWINGQHRNFKAQRGVQTVHLQDPSEETPPSEVFFSSGIIGVKFVLDDGIHYGFVELAWEPAENPVDLEDSLYRPVRWGYQPEPDTPFVIPPYVPGGLEAVTWTAEVGVTATGNDLVKSAPEATWGAGAASVQSLGGDGYVEFTTAESTAAKMAGLSNGNSDPTYQDIDFALYLGANGTVAVREGGQPRGTFGAYAAGDLFRVQVLGGVVTYWRNDALLYTSAAAPVFPLLVDTSLRTPGATISDAVIETEMFWTGRINAAADGNDLVKTAPDPTWNAGAISVNALSDDGHVEFTTGENTTAKMAGLSNGDGGTGFDDIDFAILLGANGVVGVREGGVSRGTFGAYAAGDLFRVAVTAGVVTYARNGTVFYTSGAAPTLPLLLDTSLRTPGATILDAQVVDDPSGGYNPTPDQPLVIPPP